MKKFFLFLCGAVLLLILGVICRYAWEAKSLTKNIDDQQ